MRTTIIGILGVTLAAGLVLMGCETERMAPPDYMGDNDRTAVALIPAEEFEGYVLAADEFDGTLEWDDGIWTFHGQFTFRTGGYQVEDPQITVRESHPEQVEIVLSVIEPPDDAMVTQVITEIPVEATFDASREATFEVWIERRVAQGDSETTG